MMTWLDGLFERAPRHVFGWWSFEDGKSTLVRGDGVRMRFLGPAPDDAALGIRNTGNRRWMRFELRPNADPGFTAYPLLVERRDVLDPLFKTRRPLIWRLDHVRSANLRGVQPPEPLAWQAVDRVAIDALYCWPEGTGAGVRPAEVSVSGGWRGGDWTANFYRSFSGSGIGALPGDGPFPEGLPEAPQRWDMVLPSPMASIEDAQILFHAFSSAAPRQVAALLARLTHGRPHLRSAGGQLLVPLFTKSSDPVTLRWLYADDEVITDRLQCAAASAALIFAPEWEFSLDFRRCLVGTIDRRTGDYLDFGRVSPGYSERLPRDGALLFEAGNFPSVTLARFREVVGDAVWSWRDTSFALADEAGVVREVRLAPPAQTRFWPATRYGGRERATTMRAAPQLQDADGPIRLAFMFVDDDGYAAAPRAARVGRLDFDGGSFEMIDRETGQTLAFERTLDGSPDASSDQVGIFRYRDGETHHALVVRRPARTDSEIGAEWMLDHGASVEHWRAAVRLGSESEVYPPQEWWRRVASFAFDALLAWPDTHAFGPAPASVIAAGGWWAGRWEATIRRRGTTRLFADEGSSYIRAQRRREQHPIYTPSDGAHTLVSGPADPELTLAWKKEGWTGKRSPTRGAAESFGATIPMIMLDPPGAISVDPVDLASFARERLAGRYHWVRDDGAALLYVCGEHKVISSGPEMSEVMEPLLEYCDRDVRVRLRFSYDSRLEQPVSLTLVEWPRVVRGSPLHEQEGTLPSSLFVGAPSPNGEWRPHTRLWHRLGDALEAWLDRAHAGSRAGVVARGIYLAGAFDPSGERWTWFL